MTMNLARPPGHFKPPNIPWIFRCHGAGANLQGTQWREAAIHIRQLGEIEMLDWVLSQAEVAGNLEHRVQDMQPRKGGAWGIRIT